MSYVFFNATDTRTKCLLGLLLVSLTFVTLAVLYMDWGTVVPTRDSFWRRLGTSIVERIFNPRRYWKRDSKTLASVLRKLKLFSGQICDEENV